MAQITITIPDDLLAVHVRFQQDNGALWLDAYIVAKLEELKRRFEAADQQRFEQDDIELFRLKFQLLSSGQQAAMRIQLTNARGGS